MHLGLATLLDFYRTHRRDESLVLCTIIATEGSTYRKAGAMMLIAKDGSHRGLISGGCLESDLAQHASQVFKTRDSRIVSYDLSAGDDLIWGLGIGCEGVIHLLLQRLEKSDGFGFLSALDNLLQARHSGWFSLVTASTNSEIPLASFALISDKASTGQPQLLQLNRTQESIDKHARFCQQKIQSAQGEIELFTLAIQPPPALLICGAGIDALPVARIASEMGWHCCIVDHRSGFADPKRFPSTCIVRLIEPTALATELDLAEIDAVIIMSHNLEHDRTYLSQLLKSDAVCLKSPYIGLLGPRTRHERLLREMNVEPAKMPNIHGPAGLDIGAELPASIALSIIAEIHATLNQRHGGELSPATVEALPHITGITC